MAKHGVLLDREHFIDIISPDRVADPRTTEHEADLPKPFWRNSDADLD